MRSTNQKCRNILVAAGLAASLAGCGEPVEPLGDGELAVQWEVSPHGCKAAGVTLVEVRLDNAHRSYDQTFECAEAEGFLDQIAPANYDLEVVGTDQTGRETFGSKRKRITISAERVSEPDKLRLTARPAKVEVGWRFSNGRVCGANGVSKVEVNVYDHAFYQLAQQNFRCNEGTGVIEDLIAGDYIVEAIGRADDETYLGISETTLKRGDHAVIDVELEP